MKDEIISVWLVSDNQKAYILTCNKEKAEQIFNKLKTIKNNSIYIKKITHYKERIYQIGKNLFSLKKDIQNTDELINYRNTIIKKWKNQVDSIPNANEELVWKKIAQKDDFLKNFETAEDFSTWCLDVLQYIKQI